MTLLTLSAAALLLLCFVGCQNEETRYRVLSFFFDGVPVPGAATQPELAGAALAGGAPGGRPVARVGGAPEVTYIEHPPYRERQCNACHAAGGMAVQITASAAVCGKCHSYYVNVNPTDWVHGPVALGDCGLCHLPHRSVNPGLLKKPVGQLCAECHIPLSATGLTSGGVEPGLPDRPYHRSGPTGEPPVCTNCHDPHVAGNRMLLVDSDSYLHRKREASAAVSTHKPFEERKCNICHTGNQVNLIAADINSVCLTCHEQVPREVPAVGKLHEAVRQGHCVSCHDPHKSSRPHLVRPQAEKICLGCHKPAEIAKPPHPPMQRADCLLCHAGHKSDRPHLLRLGVPMPAEAGATGVD